MGPVDANAVAHLAAEQLIARHAQPFRLRVEQRVLDRTEAFCDNAACRRPGHAIHQRIEPLVVVRRLADEFRSHALDHLRDAGGPEAFVEFAPSDDAAFGRDLDEVIVAPARIAVPRLNLDDLHGRHPPVKLRLLKIIANTVVPVDSRRSGPLEALDTSAEAIQS